MPPLAIAGVGLAAGGLGAALSAKSQKKAANTAANVQLQTADKSNALAQWMYGKNEGYLGPLATTAAPSNALLQGAAGIGDQEAYRTGFRDFIGNSDYGFQFGEGAGRINSGYAGAGALQSGAAMKALEDYRQNLQSGYRGEYNALLDRNRAFGLGAGSALAGIGQNYVGTVSANNQNAGDAAANAALLKGQYNPLANALGMFGGAALGMAR